MRADVDQLYYKLHYFIDNHLLQIIYPSKPNTELNQYLNRHKNRQLSEYLSYQSQHLLT